MPKAVDKVGMVFDQLTVVAHAGKKRKVCCVALSRAITTGVILQAIYWH